ncbi:MAG: hypothetical protein ACKO3R_04120 [bacterium]
MATVPISKQEKLAKQEFASEIEEISRRHKVDLAITKLVTNNLINKLFDDIHQSIKYIYPKPIKQAIQTIDSILDWLKNWLEKLPGMKATLLNKRNAFDEFTSGDLLYQKAKELGIQMLPIDAHSKDRLKFTLYDRFKDHFINLIEIASLLYDKEDLAQMPEFLKENKIYQEFIETFKQLDSNVQKQLLDDYKSLWDEVSAKTKQYDDNREVTIASNLENAFNSTNGNTMMLFGSRHLMKLLPDDQSPSAIKQLADKGVPTISIKLISRDLESVASLSSIPESTKPQYLKTCHSLINIDLVIPSHGNEKGKDIKLAQAHDAIITIPKLVA